MLFRPILYTALFCCLFPLETFSQREIDYKAKGADPNYQPISVTGTPNCNYFNSGLTLVFSDEFNGNTLDTNLWKPSYPWGIANNDSSDSWCDTQEILFTGNTIKLGVNKNPNNNVLLDGQIITRDYGIGVISSKQAFNYGYYEIRCKIPRVAELWPAFWMFGDCGQEIDVFEFLGANLRSSKPKPFHDPLWACSPHRSRWYMPPECASANPIMTFHTPDPTKTPCTNIPGARRVVGRTLEFSSWKVKPSPLNFNKGCMYDNVEVDVDFHADWHTFAVSFQPDAITWYIDGQAQFTEYKYFIKSEMTLPFNFKQVVYDPVCLAEYCFGSFNQTLYEQMNFLRGDIDMKIIINNNHKALQDYNWPRWVDDVKNWEDGYMEIDYFRYYKFTDTNKDPSSCKSSSTDFISFDLFPNPSNGHITISTNSSLLVKHVQIINSMGAVVYTSSFSSKDQTFDLNLSSGLYYLRVFCNGSSSCKKVVIE